MWWRIAAYTPNETILFPIRNTRASSRSNATKGEPNRESDAAPALQSWNEPRSRPSRGAMEEVHAAPAPPATGGSTAPRRKILVRRPKKARDALMQTAEAEGESAFRIDRFAIEPAR